MTFPKHNLALSLALLPMVVWMAPPARADDAPSTFFLIDGSGSMWGRFEPDKRAKIDAVRELLKPVITSAGSSRIGIGSFGHRRKGDCSDVEIFAAPVTEREPVLAPLEKLNPKGKGPLVEGLRQSVAAIGANRPASIIVINDGADNCQQDACAAAAEIAQTSPGVAIHMISIGVDPADHPRLACVAKETGGQFFDVADPIALAAAIGDAVGRTPAAPKDAAPSAAGVAPKAAVAEASFRATAVLAEGAAALAMPVSWRAMKEGASDTVASAESAQFSAALDPGNYDIEAKIGSFIVKRQVTIEAGKPASIIVPLNAGRLKVRAKYAKDGASAGAAIVSVLKAGTDSAGTVWLGRIDSADAILPAGTYTVSIADGHIRQERQVTLSAGSDDATDFILGAGRVELSAVLHDGGEALTDVTFTVAEDDPESPDGRREIGRSFAPTAEFQLPAGTYYVSARSGDAETRQRIAVSAGDAVVKRTLSLGAARLKVSAPEIPTTAQEGHGIVYRIIALDGDKREVARSSKPAFEALLNAGQYRITATLEAHNLTAAQDIVLEAGKTAETVIKFDAAQISFKFPAATSAIPGEIFWEIKDKNGRAFWHSAASEPQILLAPGRYTVRLETRDRGTQAAFEVRTGESRQIELGTVSAPTPE